ncbi:FabD/lysophospholipase-like protein [Pleurotus eryngii]|uniref:Lysophospholipase n=1 Tax=Pleurotus eryngii TaxID=5323 RepID=A0A9P5ZQ99_PLEER|nr:FabD/lysophospholipase-like protein [Pleurotus eryngii]
MSERNTDPTPSRLYPTNSGYPRPRTRTREPAIIPAEWDSWLGDGSHLGYQANTFKGKYPKVGMAFSGGGYRAAQYGAGVLNALDARNASAKAAGRAGFSKYRQITDLVFGNKDLPGWLLDLDLVLPDGINMFDDKTQAYFGSILSSAVAKPAAGMRVLFAHTFTSKLTSVIRALQINGAISYHFLNDTDRNNFFTDDSAHGAGQLWSHILSSVSFQQHSSPFPIVVFNSRPANWDKSADIPLDATVYEVTPFAFESYNPGLSAMMNLTFVGTSLDNGRPQNDTSCVTDLDQAGFIMGSSSSLFNALLDDDIDTVKGFSGGDAKGLLYILSRELESVQSRADDVANWPNPFTNIKPTTSIDSNAMCREVDVIVAVDTDRNDEVDSWPQGISLLTTSKRLSTLLTATHQSFLPIPQFKEHFLSTGVNGRSTFFGCDPAQTPAEYPLVIYLPNSAPLNSDDPVTNTDTVKLDYILKRTRLLLNQTFTNTIGGFKPDTDEPDPYWPKCLKCAAIDRGRHKSSLVMPRSDICNKRFKQYCFDPQNPPSQDSLPNRRLKSADPDPQGPDKLKAAVLANKPALIGGVVGVVSLVVMLIGFTLLVLYDVRLIANTGTL